MDNITRSIWARDYTIRAWIKKHVKWIKDVICYISGRSFVDADSGEVCSILYVVVDTYAKNNHLEVYTLVSGNDDFASCRKVTMSDIEIDEEASIIVSHKSSLRLLELMKMGMFNSLSVNINF